MPSYKAPLRDIRFVMDELLELDQRPRLPGHEEITPDTVNAVLEAAATLSEEVLFPLNRSGDEEGSVFENGVVRTPKGFKKAYEAFTAGGWTGLACDPAYGGQGLPHLLQFVVEEMLCSANLSFAMFPGLSQGAYAAIERHATPELKATYLPHLAKGDWSGTMCLTEPHCGTDLGLIRTRAQPKEDGKYAITGTKIFISAGEHDLTDNIIHLVLARLPDAPPGIRGISLFLVPKILVKDRAGELGPRNGVRCGSIEHKMGIKASPTCVLNFDEAEGYLVGEKHRGMRCMFTMMNAARLGVGMQGLALAEVSYQNARDYARDRLQGRSLKGAQYPDKPADPIIVHPDVRKNLLTIKAFTEGARALAYWIGAAIDEAERHPDAGQREAAEDLVALMTPVIKAYFTDQGFASTVFGQQVLGGHGYIREWGMEQYVRDARIAQIYEGANGIQALDLVGRKLPQHMGRLLRRFFHPVDAFIQEHGTDPALAEFVLPLAKAFARLQQATAQVAEKGLKDPDEAGAAASDYLRLFALVALAFMWARMVKVAHAKLGADPEGFYKAKIATARFYMQRVLPESNALFQSLIAGARPLMEMEVAAF
ncbi:MAG: acyl-CoA dehydrogenase C-terminal domain-containing protein [Proteobacteria bacterium]|nr:acyl-CoA dehydrogenase C-terminal domain-containing protein [Pseudomonadota bacterium]MBI3498360.1 acyl-CoA dehydrogenase C-terminal domain-containing protein [Pseudomonadota bacterium]